MKERQAYQTPSFRMVLLKSQDVIASSYDKGEEDIFSGVEAQQVWDD